MSLTRRSLFGGAAAVGIAAATGSIAQAAPNTNARAFVKGATARLTLSNIVDNGKLALPKGLSAIRVSTIGVEALLNDRNGKVIGTTPSNLDGTGAFDVAGGVRLIRNHECRANSDVPVPLVAGTVYDAGCAQGMGGNTVVETGPQGDFKQQWVALSGTIRNCAGGETPWGTWLSCEEDTTKAGTVVTSSVDGQKYTLEKDHGYVFEVFPDAVARQCPMPIKAWGRAVFEGAAIDPDLTKAYLTEDTKGGLFYRWVAPEGTKLGAYIAKNFGENDGMIQAAQLVRNGKALVHYGELSASDLDKAYPVTWIDGGDDRQAQKTDLRKQFPGATVHPKIEGCWVSRDGKGLWFTLSYVSASEAEKYGIDEDWGMIMFYDFADETLTLKDLYPAGNTLGAVVPGDATEEIKQFNGPDNITVSPWGSVVITEDGDNPCSLIGYKERTKSFEFARDLGDRGEWAGPCFNKSGNVLFASVQSDCTYAIRGALGQYLGGK